MTCEGLFHCHNYCRANRISEGVEEERRRDVLCGLGVFMMT